MDEAERCERVGYQEAGQLLAVGTPTELKCLPGIIPPGMICLEIIGPDLSDLLKRLRNRPGMHQVVPFGHTLHVFVNVDDMPDDLDESGFRMRVIEPSLEDVFVSLARQRLERMP
jgi:ABC-2 type transport system ATP-binding protein